MRKSGDGPLGQGDVEETGQYTQLGFYKFSYHCNYSPTYWARAQVDLMDSMQPGLPLPHLQCLYSAGIQAV